MLEQEKMIGGDKLVKFREEFSKPSLDPPWQVVSGLGSYSLTDKPGYLRYYLNGPRACSGGWRKVPPSPGWQPSLALIRPFEGDRWVLRAKAIYNIRACDDVKMPPTHGSTGAQGQCLYVAFGSDVNDYLTVYRVTDWWFQTNTAEAALISDGGEVARCEFLAPDDEIRQEEQGGWARHAYWFEIVKDRQVITFRYSHDGMKYITGFSASLAKPTEAMQRAIIDGNVWTTAGSYVDWEYIYAEDIEVPIQVKETSKIDIYIDEKLLDYHPQADTDAFERAVNELLKGANEARIVETVNLKKIKK
jgi:hypothetical protein